jgi:NADH:ubiquinone oxidoreductase subunit F (NADH-binding)
VPKQVKGIRPDPMILMNGKRNSPCASTASRARCTSSARVPHADYPTYRATGGYALAAAVANGSVPAARVLQAMNDSGLRGLGGAGFPAGRKWRLVRDQPAPRIPGQCNADEGEPGTFKDRT